MTRAGRYALALALMLISPAPVAAQEIGDAARGEKIFAQCQFCHQVGKGAENRIGPHLNGLFGRRAGSLDGFDYSKGLARAGSDGMVWTAETLDVYLENPRSLVSGTRMSFGGLKTRQDRDDVLAYLRAFSVSPQNIPEAQPTGRPTDPDLAPEILAIEGDREYGAYLSSECLTCHQRDGSSEGIPPIVNWPVEDFVVAMHAYKRKMRPHPVMQMMASRLSDEEIAALAAYFSELDR